MSAKKVQPASREFDMLVRAIGDCKSKAEEDAIIGREVDVLKAHVKDPRMNERHVKEILVRLMYVEMLGHDASWGHVTALRACSSKLLLTKKVAYLASTLFLDSSSELIVLIVNTLSHDLMDDNFLIVCSALTVVTRLIGPDMVAAVAGPVVALLAHPREIVRKKAVSVLHRFEQLVPTLEGPLGESDIESHLRRMLCDKDPSVMGAVLCALGELAPRNPGSFRNLAPSFISILKQITDGLLHKSYDYHKVPAPFLQIKLLKLLAVVGAGHVATSEAMYAVVGAVMGKAATYSSTIGNAIVYEAARTITTIHPNSALLQSAGEIIATFLRASSHNQKYIGIDVLARMVRINPKYAAEHQLAVVDCLEDKDDALKKKTLELLFKMANPNNVEVIVEKMIEYLRSCGDEVAKADAVQRISDLSERYAPDTLWFIDTMNQVFELGGDAVPSAMAGGLSRLIAEGGGGSAEEDSAQIQAQVVASCMDLLPRPKISDVLLTVILWVLGEYGTLADVGATGVLMALGTLAEKSTPSDFVRGYLLSAMAKLTIQSGVPLPAAVEQAVHDAATSRDTDLQQRALELQALLKSTAAVRRAALPSDASAVEVEVDTALPFLDTYVAAAVQNGAAPYLPAPERHKMGAVRTSAHDEAAVSVKPMNFKAYERPPVPVPTQLPSVSFPIGAETGGGDQGAPQISGRIAAAAAAPIPPPMLLNKAGGGRWGPPPSSALHPPPADSSTYRTPGTALATHGPPPTEFGGGISSSSRAGGAPKAMLPRPSETAEQLLLRAQRERRAAALFGSSASATAASDAGPRVRQSRQQLLSRRPLQQDDAQPTPPREEASLLSLGSDDPPQAAGADLIGSLHELALGGGESALNSQVPAQQQLQRHHAIQQQGKQEGRPSETADLVSLLGDSLAESAPQSHLSEQSAAQPGARSATASHQWQSPAVDLIELTAAAQAPAAVMTSQQPMGGQQARGAMHPVQTKPPADPFDGLF